MSRHFRNRADMSVILHDEDDDNSSMASSIIPLPSLSTGSQSSVSDRRSSASSQIVFQDTRPKVNIVHRVDTTNSSSNSSLRPPLTPLPPADHVTYRCLFYILPCDHQSNDIEIWKTHVLSHFRGLRLPSTASCQWCPLDFKHPSSRSHSGEENDNDNDNDHFHQTWNAMLNHVAHDHFERGHTLAASRSNFELMKFMYQSKIITEDQLKAIQLCPSPDSPAYHPSQDSIRASIGSADEPYCSTYSPRREKRLREQRRGVSVT